MHQSCSTLGQHLINTRTRRSLRSCMTFSWNRARSWSTFVVLKNSYQPGRIKVWASLFQSIPFWGPKKMCSLGKAPVAIPLPLTQSQQIAPESFYNLSPGVKWLQGWSPKWWSQRKPSQCVLVSGLHHCEEPCSLLTHSLLRGWVEPAEPTELSMWVDWLS